MSIPPQVIRVKRKRVEESPVIFLQFDQDSKRHLGGRDWAYQRRETTAPRAARDTRSTQPIIHVSKPDDAPGSNKSRNEGQASEKAKQRPNTTTGPLEPRKFHVSRATLAKRSNQDHGPGAVTKKSRYSSAVFVESARKKMTPKTRRGLAAGPPPEQDEVSTVTPDATPEEAIVEQRQLKRPAAVSKADSAAAGQRPFNKTPSSDSFPSRHNEDMEKITNDMNEWVLNELGANLESMEQEKRTLRFKPKSPAKRYHERHAELAAQAPTRPQTGVATREPSDDDDDDDDDDEWIIEEYVRIPAHSVAMDVEPTDVGILFLDEEEESTLFFGSALDEDEELEEDDEDENAENHYAADYPEDEADSDDEHARDAYLYRRGNNSEDEEFDEALYEEQDDVDPEGDADEDDDARMARIREFMKRHSAFGQ